MFVFCFLGDVLCLVVLFHVANYDGVSHSSQICVYLLIYTVLRNVPLINSSSNIYCLRQILLFCKFFLMNFFALHKSVCGWLHNQQIICLLFYLSICLCVDFLCIVPALVLDLYRGNFCFSSCLGMLFPMWLIYFFKRLPRHVSHFISLTPPYTNKVSLVVL